MKRFLSAAAALAAVCGAIPAAAQAPDPYATSGGYTVDGTVKMVDPDRDRVGISTDDGRNLTIDTFDTKFVIVGKPGETGDLVKGMRVEVTGYMLDDTVLAADKLTVLSLAPPAPGDKGPQAASSPRYSKPGSIRLRGTVVSADDETGAVVVKVNDHTRTVLVDQNTDLTDITAGDENHIGVHPGDRITVQGRLLANGTVRATAISHSKNLDQAVDEANGSDTDDNSIQGPVVHTADKFSGNRDIQVMVSPSRTISVHVPRTVHVIRSNRSISLYDLTGDDTVRVRGSYDPNGDFTATEIDVLQKDSQ